MTPLEFVVHGAPVSGATSQYKRLKRWKSAVTLAASLALPPGIPIERKIGLRLSIVYLSDAPAPDVDNIIKPIQDALMGLAYITDLQITDVDCHRRKDASPDAPHLPALLRHALRMGAECVYIRVSDALNLEAYS